MSEARRLSSVVDESERQDVSTIAAPQASVPVYEDEEERYLTPRKKAIECLLLFSLARFFFLRYRTIAIIPLACRQAS